MTGPAQQMTDCFGDLWDVCELRDGPGFAIYFGRPTLYPRGGKRVIPTAKLRDYIHAHNKRGMGESLKATLPIGKNAIVRLKKLFGFDQELWWREREHDLATMTGAEFAKKHNTLESSASINRQKLLGIHRERPFGWWREQPARDILLSDLPRAVVADKLDIAVSIVGQLRWFLRTGK